MKLEARERYPMSFVYHGCPEIMKGSVLYPLNELRTRHPEVYRRALAKYEDHPDRAKLPSTILPLLDCLWNDVLHCSPIHPPRLDDAWRAQGVERVPRKTFFQIPVDRVGHHPVAVMRGRELEWLNTACFQEITAVPAETVEWYRKLARQERFGAHFVGVPHILVKGPIDIEGVEIVNWRDPIGPPAIP